MSKITLSEALQYGIKGTTKHKEKLSDDNLTKELEEKLEGTRKYYKKAYITASNCMARSR